MVPRGLKVNRVHRDQLGTRVLRAQLVLPELRVQQGRLDLLDRKVPPGLQVRVLMGGRNS